MEPASFPVFFSIDVFLFARLFTNAKTACPIFEGAKKENFSEREYLYP